MHLSLSDYVTCPRCGPGYGLVLLPHHVEERRVRSGVLGCANCRERYGIEDWVADLRPPGGIGADRGQGREAGSPGAPGQPGDREQPERAAAVRLAALLGLAEATGFVLLVGGPADLGPDIAGLVPGVEVMVAGGEGRGGEAGRPTVTPLRLAGPIPFKTGTLTAVALGPGHGRLLEEAARALGPAGRLVLEAPPPEARSRVEAVGMSVVAEEDGAGGGVGTLVAGH